MRTVIFMRSAQTVFLMPNSYTGNRFSAESQDYTHLQESVMLFLFSACNTLCNTFEYQKKTPSHHNRVVFHSAVHGFCAQCNIHSTLTMITLLLLTIVYSI